MKEDELNIEQILYEDAQSIAIDEQFKNDLKNKFMSLENSNIESSNNVIDLPKRNNKLTHNKYLRIASGFAICVLVGGAWIRVKDNVDMVDNSSQIIVDKEKKPSIENKFKGPNEENVQIDSSTGKVAIEKIYEKKHIDKIVSEHSNKPVTSNEDSKPKKDNEVKNKDDGKINNNLKPSQQAKGGTLVAVDPNKKHTNISDINNDNNELTNEEINKKISEKPPQNASVKINTKSPINNTSIVDLEEEVHNCYDSRYSVDGNSLIVVKDDGIYIKKLKSSQMVKILDNDSKKYVINKSNFTQDGNIIYYKAEKVIREGGSFEEKNGAIYISKLDGTSNEKLIDGINPMISKDGKKLTYETEGKIYIMNLNTKSKIYVDDGKYPAWSENGNMLSYVKENKEKEIYDKITEKKDVYIEKIYSTIWIYNIESGNKLNLSNEKIDVDNKNLQSWAAAIRDGAKSSNFDVHGKYTYYESIWNNNNKELFVIRRNNEVEVYELIKYNLGNILN